MAVSILAPAGLGQGLPDQLNFSHSNTEGFHLYGASVFFAGSTYDFLPPPASQTAAQPLNRSAQYGAGGTIGWQHFRSRFTAAARYTASYNGTSQNSSLNSLNHSLAFDLSRPLGTKWQVSLAAAAQEMSLNQSIFEPTSLAAISQTASTFNDLSAALSVGQFSSAQSGVLLSGSSAANSPALSALLGGRMLTYSANASVSYALSSRLRFQFGSFALGGQHRSSDAISGAAVNYVLPATVGGTGSMSMSYSLSTRTTVGVALAESYASSLLQKAYSTNATASIGRKMGRNWLLSANGGVSFTENAQQITGKPPDRQMIWGGTVGYRTRAHTFAGSYNRSASDSNTGAIGANSSYSGAWNWRTPHSGWGFHASFMRNESNTGFSSLSGSYGGAGVSRALRNNLSLLIDGSYLHSRGIFSGNQNAIEVYAIRLSLGWTPRLFRNAPSAADEPEDVK